MILIPKGPFLYGDDNEFLTIDYDYYMDIYPVTNQHYAPFIRASGYDNEALWSKEGWGWKEEGKISQPKLWDDPKWNQSGHPVVGVSYFEAEAFANWAGKRLPTEQEWEKAARGTDGRTYPWGDTFGKNKCNCYDSGIGGTTPVTRYADGKSPFGCHDMAGNVFDWCASWYDNSKDSRVLRGGSWVDGPDDLRCAARRLRFHPRNSDQVVGFRCAQDAP
ncbi:MAG: SUMF1/EgtB/PvdO family nonheme iron enzyme [Nitrospinae bacterium]|nr:SUMF1/EgtB/PvdO family nonheme iron enzyme [Nitrospinota bacterium]